MQKRTSCKKSGGMRPINLYVALFVMLLLSQAAPFARTDTATENVLPEISQEGILGKRTQLKEEIERVRALIAWNAREAAESSSSLLEHTLEMLEHVDLVHGQQLSQLKRSCELRETINQLKKDLSDPTFRELAQPAIYKFWFLDELQEKLIFLEGQRGIIEAAITAAEVSLEAAQDTLRSADQDLRRIREALASKGEEPFASPAFAQAQLVNRLARESAYLRKASFENEELELEAHELTRAILRREIALMEPSVRFTRKELNDHLIKIEEDSLNLNNRLIKLRAREESVHSRRTNAQKQLDTISASVKAQRKEQEVLVWKTWSDTRHLEVETLSRMLMNNEVLKEIWQYRHGLFNKADSVDLSTWGKEFTIALEELNGEECWLTASTMGCRNKIAALQKKLAAVKAASGITWFIEEQINAFIERERVFQEGLENMQAVGMQYRKLLREIAQKEQQKSIQERAAQYWNIVRHIWRSEIGLG